MRRTLGAAVLVVVVWAIQDILVWQRFFEARQLWQFNDQYQFWHQAFLLALIAVGASLLRGRLVIAFVTATWTLAYGGLADVLYYLLDGRSVPPRLPWLDHGWNQLLLFHPVTNAIVLLSAAAWLGLWLGIVLVAPIAQRLLVVAGLRYRNVIRERDQNRNRKQDSRPQPITQEFKRAGNDQH